MFIVWILIGIIIGLILACLFPIICKPVNAVIQVAKSAWNWLKGKFGGQAGE